MQEEIINSYVESECLAQSATPAQRVAYQLMHELARSVANIHIMTGSERICYIEAADDKHLGGIVFPYDRNLTSNKSDTVRIYARPDGLRDIIWFSQATPFSPSKQVDEARDIKPEELYKTWYEHTACSLVPPIGVVCQPHKFSLGQVVYTARAEQTFMIDEVFTALMRHARGDWGDICKEDAEENELSLDRDEPGRLMSVYKYPDGRVMWIITEWDRSVTTALLPEDY